VGHLAGRYLRDRGFKRLAFVGRAGASYAHVRLKGLREQVAPLGIQVKSLESTDRAAGPEPGFVQQERVLDDWLGSLDAPVGVLASNDNIGRLVSESAFRLGIAVPEEMAILSVDNDDVICAMAYPPMSSVELAGRRIGQTAAGILERLMAGEEVPEPQRRVLLPPLGVVTRQSTDTVAVSDPHVAAAVRYIREHVDESLSVGQVLRHVPVARRTLEQRFRRHLGRTPLEEIRLAKLDRARYLLAATAEPIARIACQCGFRDAAFFSRVFREACGLSPSAYRKEQRGEW
jgi:LacI family transcriptional regulator